MSIASEIGSATHYSERKSEIREFLNHHLTEQSAIVNFLDRETTKLDTLTTEAKTAITLLQERRTALISAAVTGKIDVRGLVSAKTEVQAETVPC
ncbi:MAG: hypothetical protein V9G16_01355 [Nitrosomonas sp.]